MDAGWRGWLGRGGGSWGGMSSLTSIAMVWRKPLGVAFLLRESPGGEDATETISRFSRIPAASLLLHGTASFVAVGDVEVVKAPLAPDSGGTGFLLIGVTGGGVVVSTADSLVRVCLWNFEADVDDPGDATTWGEIESVDEVEEGDVRFHDGDVLAVCDLLTVASDFFGAVTGPRGDADGLGFSVGPSLK